MTKRTDGSRRIDEYIAGSAEFARPICRKLRAIIQKADPEIAEDWKWGPHYSKNGMVCNFGAFKNHVGLAFFKGALMKDPAKLFIRESVPAKSMRRINFTSLDEVSEGVIASYIKNAVDVNATNPGRVAGDKTLLVPKALKALLKANKKAAGFFDSLSFTNRKEYVRWIETAKKDETRSARLKKTLALLTRKVQHP